MRRICAHLVGIFVLVQLILAPDYAYAERRLALVVGLDNYRNLPRLSKALNDAGAIAYTLKDAGFAVTELLDPDSETLLNEFSRFTSSIAAGDEVVFYYAGHGVEIEGRNLLLASDTKPVVAGQEIILRRQALGVDEVLSEFSRRGARVALLIIDACRDNPFPSNGTRSIGSERGLARIDPPRGSFVLYSAGVGQTALDSLGQNDPNPNSVFTRALLPLLQAPGLSVQSIARDVRDTVLSTARTVGHEQFPAYYDQLSADFALIHAKAEVLAESLSTDQASTSRQSENGSECDGARADWALVKDLKDKDILLAFLQEHSSCALFSKLAKHALAALTSSATSVQPLPPQSKPAASISADTPQVPLVLAKVPTAKCGVNGRLAEEEFKRVTGDDATRKKKAEAYLERFDTCEPHATLARAILSEVEGAEAGQQVALLTKQMDELRTLLAYKQKRREELETTSTQKTDPDHRDSLPQKYADLLRRAEDGDASAMLELAQLYNGDTDIPKNVSESVRWTRRAAEAGNPKGMAALGYIYDNGLTGRRSDTDAMRWYRAAAEAGDTKSMLMLGSMYEEGRIFSQSDIQAFRWYKLSADAGESDAMFKVAQMFDAGRGIDRSETQAIRWFKAAAEAGHAMSMASLGTMYEEGRIFAQSDTQAYRWFRLAAEAGDASGMAKLGKMFDKGLGVSRSDSEAARWLLLAIQNGESSPIEHVSSYSRGVIRELQYRLGYVGLYKDATDGIAGKATIAAMKAYKEGWSARSIATHNIDQ